MKKIILIAMIALGGLIPSLAYAQNYWVPFVGGALFGYVVSRPPAVYYPQPIFVQPPPQTVYIQPPVTYYQQALPAPQCVLRSEIVNGQIVQGTYCY